MAVEDAVPMEKLQISTTGPDGKSVLKPAFDVYWVESCQYPRYYQLLKLDANAKQEWMENTTELIEVCRWLLSLPQHQFWSQIIYGDSGWKDMLESYLANCPRPFDSFPFKIAFGDGCKKVAESVALLHRYVFKVHWRLGSWKESEMTQISPEFYAKMIRQNGVLDLITLMNLSVIYGPNNRALLTQLCANMIKIQPKYVDDLKSLASGVVQRLEDVESQLNRLTTRKNRSDKPSDEAIDQFGDLIAFLVDTTYSLNAFVDCCSRAKEVFYDVYFMARIPTIHESLVIPLKKELSSFSLGGFEELPFKSSLGQIGYVSDGLARLFRKLFDHNILNCLLKEGDCRLTQASEAELVAEFVHTMTSLVSDPEFLLVYDKLFPFDLDCSNLIFKDVQIDCDQLSYIADAIGKVTQTQTTLPPAKPQPPAAVVWPKEENSRVFSQPTVRTRTKAEIDDSVRQIYDVLPHLNRIVIEEALRRFNFDTEETLNALLTDTYQVPADVPSSSTSTKPQSAALRPLEDSQKRGTSRVLESKGNVVDPHFYDRFKLETPESDEEDSEVAWNERLEANPNHAEFDYEDEYDDTYDSHNVGAADAQDPDDLQLDPTPKPIPSEPVVAAKGENFYSTKKENVSKAAKKEDNSAGGYTGGYHRAQKDRNRATEAHHNRKEMNTRKFAKGFGAPSTQR